MTNKQEYYPQYYIPQKLLDIIYCESAPSLPLKENHIEDIHYKDKCLLGIIKRIYRNLFHKSQIVKNHNTNEINEHRKYRYELQLKEYETKQKLFLESKNLQHYRQKLLTKELSGDEDYSFGNIEQATFKEVTKGVGEMYFRKYLIAHGRCDKYFEHNFTLLKNRKVSLERRIYYYPDIILKDKDGIYIDIEIDEPYSMNENNAPIHYVGFDDARNKKFLDNDWIVIRFSEKQIFEYTKQCYDFIISLHKCIHRCDMSLLEIDKKFICPIWSKEESIAMMKEKYRQTYIPYRLNKLQIKRNKRIY